MTVTQLFARLAQSKLLWAHTRATDPDWDRRGADGKVAADQLAETPAADLEEVLLKATELQDILAEDATAAQAALIASIVKDLERFATIKHHARETPGGASPPPPPTPTPAPLEEPKGPKNPVAFRREVRIDRRARPVTIDGRLFPSIMAAADATGISYSELLKTRAA